MSAGHHFHGMIRQNSLPRVDLLAAPDRMGPGAPNANQLFCGGWVEGFPRQALAAQNSWSTWAPTWAPCGHDMGRRRWTQPVHGSERQVAPVVGRASLPAQSPQFHNQHVYAPYVTVVTPRALGYQVSAPQVACAGSAARSASVGALRPVGSELSHPGGPARPAGVSHFAIPGRAQNAAAVSTVSTGLLTERMDRMPGTKPPGLSASQSRQPCEGPGLNAESLTRGTFELHEDPAQEANSQPEAVATTAAQPGSPCRSAGKPQQSSATVPKTQFGLLTPPSQRSLRKSPSSVRSPTSSIAFPGSFVLRQSAPQEPQEGKVDAEENGLAPSEPRPWPNSIPDEIGDSKLSPVPLSPSSSAFASFSPGDIDFGQKDLAKSAESCCRQNHTQRCGEIAYGRAQKASQHFNTKTGATKAAMHGLARSLAELQKQVACTMPTVKLQPHEPLSLSGLVQFLWAHFQVGYRGDRDKQAFVRIEESVVWSIPCIPIYLFCILQIFIEIYICVMCTRHDITTEECGTAETIKTCEGIQATKGFKQPLSGQLTAQMKHNETLLNISTTFETVKTTILRVPMLRAVGPRRRYAVAAILAAVLCVYGIKTLNFVGSVIQASRPECSNIITNAKEKNALAEFLKPRMGKGTVRELPSNAEMIGTLKIVYEVTLSKPLGITLADAPRGPGFGVGVEEVLPGGNADKLLQEVLAGKDSMWIQDGDELEAVNGVLTDGYQDKAVELVGASGDEVKLQFSRPRKGFIKVVFPGGKSITSPRAAILQRLAEKVGYNSGCTSKDGRDEKCWYKDPATGEENDELRVFLGELQRKTSQEFTEGKLWQKTRQSWCDGKLKVLNEEGRHLEGVVESLRSSIRDLESQDDKIVLAEVKEVAGLHLSKQALLEKLRERLHLGGGSSSALHRFATAVRQHCDLGQGSHLKVLEDRLDLLQSSSEALTAEDFRGSSLSPQVNFLQVGQVAKERSDRSFPLLSLFRSERHPSIARRPLGARRRERVSVAAVTPQAFLDQAVLASPYANLALVSAMEARPIPIIAVGCLEEFVTDVQQPAAARLFMWWWLCMVFASLRYDDAMHVKPSELIMQDEGLLFMWWWLCMVFASLRYDDAMHVKPSELIMQDEGLFGVAWQTKVERKRRGTKFVVPRVGFKDANWPDVGWDLLQAEDLDRDYWMRDLNTQTAPAQYQRSIQWLRFLGKLAIKSYFMGTESKLNEAVDGLLGEIGLQANWKNPGPLVLKYTRNRSSVPAQMVQQLVKDMIDNEHPFETEDDTILDSVDEASLDEVQFYVKTEGSRASHDYRYHCSREGDEVTVACGKQR
eukprot:s2086_g3.t1